MSYSQWLTKNEMMKNLVAVDPKKDIESSSLPILYDNNLLYMDGKEAHSLIVGSTGSGKTQVSILPSIHLAMNAKESMVVNDCKGELYDYCADILLKNGYKVIALNFENAKTGNSWNPLTLPYQLFKEGELDKAYELVEDLGYYLLFDAKDKNQDPFWFNSARDYFVGLVLYLFKNAKEAEINLLSVNQLHNDLHEGKKSQEFLNKIDKSSNIYANLIGTLNAPAETKGSIFSVFTQRIKKYIARELLSNMLSVSDFDIKNIGNEKTAVFLISGQNSFCESLIPLFVNQVVDSIEIYGNKEKQCHILLDEFDNLIPIHDFGKMTEYVRSIKIRFTVVIRSFQHLNNMYSPEESALLKLCFGNIVYLLSNDIYTLQEVSDYCGKKNAKEPLITVEELKLLKPFEAIILMPRRMPFRTTLIPDYKIDWGYQSEKAVIPKREIVEVQIFKY